MCPIANIVNRYVTLHLEKLRTLKIFHSGLILRPVQRALKKTNFFKVRWHRPYINALKNVQGLVEIIDTFV